MSFAISLTVFAFSTMDISECLKSGTDTNTCLVANPTAHKQFLASAITTFLLLALLVGHECLRVYLQGFAHPMKSAVELAFYSGTLTFLCTWLDLSRGSKVSGGSLAFSQASASVLVFTSWFLYFLDGKVSLF